ncbi:putative transcriptional regulator [Carbonactinospora thermoautotrophica]|uniref:Putative transcriptional regulator n=1 Tax=Carbonactinospora thermoautotrophica TaxID=1469144 RepID=A0A132MN31_9ACTN|nr:putative transcriptional regulator [Carbonactinospora thermoautotrophica]
MAALVRLLAPLEIAAPAVRTAISRMVRQGWLTPVKLSSGPGYALTPRAVRRLDEAIARIYRTHSNEWDGHWHVLVTSRVPERSRRERVRAGLSFLGYAPLDDTTWIGPRRSPEADALLEAESLRAERFTARHDGDSASLVRRLWDIEGLARSYERWLEDARELVRAADDNPDDETAFAVRSRLLHEWRKFLFRDPGLPRQLLPEDWPGDEAAKFFDLESSRLLPAANRFVDACLEEESSD